MKKHGKMHGLQRYRCLQCGKTFSSKRKPRKAWIHKAYEDYTIHKQSYKELSKLYGKSGKTLRKLFDKFAGATGEVFEDPEPFVLILDATFFGRGYGILMARNVKKVLYWQEIASESIHEYELCLNQLDAMGYTFTAFVIDGRTGVRQFLMKRYPGKPIQLCQFHQIETVKRYIPMRAKTEAGKRLRQTLGLAKTYAAEFEQDLNNWYAKEKIINFKIDLNEKMNDFGRKGNNWLEPFKEWILSAHQAVRYANTENLEEKRMFLQKIAIS